MFKGTNITSISIPEGITNIEWGCFQDCEQLKKLNLPDSVETVGSDALPDALEEITFGRNFKSKVELHVSGAANNPPLVMRFKGKTVPTSISFSGTTARKLIFITSDDNSA